MPLGGLKNGIRRAMHNTSQNVRKPSHVYQKKFRINKVIGEYQNKFKREPTIQEISEETGYPKRDIKLVQIATQREISLQYKIGDQDSSREHTIEELIADDKEDIIAKARDVHELSEVLSEYLNSLHDREKEVVTYRFGLDGNEPESLENIAKKMGRTRERVRQIQEKALGKLRDLMMEKFPELEIQGDNKRKKISAKNRKFLKMVMDDPNLKTKTKAEIKEEYPLIYQKLEDAGLLYFMAHSKREYE